MALNELKYKGWHRGVGDDTFPNGLLEALVPTDSRQLHFASATDANSDWGLAQQTHPTFYWHSETTPITDYISMYHDATNGYVNVASGSLALQVDGTTVVTVASGSITHSQDVIISSGFGLNVGSATQVTVSNGDGATNLIPEGQFLGVGTAFAGGAVLIATFNATNDRTVSPKLAFLKGAAATQVATTAVADNEVVGSIIAYGSDTGDFETPVAAIEFVVDDVGVPGASAIGGSLEFYTTADGGTTLTLSFTINNDQNIYVGNGNGVVVGHTAQITAGSVAELQVLGTALADASVIIGVAVASAVGPELQFSKSRAGTIGTVAASIVSDNDEVGRIVWLPADSVDFATEAAVFQAEVDDGSPAAGDIGMAFVWESMAGGGAAIAERMRLNAAGDLLIADAGGVVIGHTAQIAVLAATPELQVLGTAAADSSLVLLRSSADTSGPVIYLAKARDAIGTFTTAITTGDVLGGIEAIGADATDLNANGNAAAAIRFVSSGTIGDNRIPGEIRFLTATNAAPSVLTTALTLNNAQNATFAAAVTMSGTLTGANAVLGSAGNSMTIRGSDNVSGAAASLTLADSVASNGAMTIVTHNVADTSETTRLTVAGGGTDVAITTAAAHVVVGAPAAPTAVGTTPGTAASNILAVTGGLGGNTTIATTGIGGIGGGYSFTGGAGGTANSATTAATGGAGGAFAVTTGAGAAAAVAGVDSTGGASGAITLLSGDGGAVSLAVSGTATGGRAGVVTIQGGVGGAVTATTGTNVGGAGGDVSAIAGAGGAASGATDTGGRGGDVAITAGGGGNGDTGGRGGNITLTPGAVGTGGSPVVGAMLLAGGYVFQSSSATEIGISVVNTALAVGTSGSLVIPYLSTTGAAFTDAIGGDVNGAIGINYDSDTGPTSTLEVRSNGAWVSVAVTGYLMQNRVPWARETTFLSHPNQVFEDEGRTWIDESLCYICGEKMTPGEQVTFWANGPTERGVHAIFGHVHAERNDYIRGLEARIIELEQKLLVPVFA